MRLYWVALLLPLGCYDKPSAAESETEGTGTAEATSADTGSSSTADTGDCVDACTPEGATCNGDELRVCAPGPDGCLALDTTLCTMGCAQGMCVGVTCGDGSLGRGEDCDDGNTDDGDGCSGMCAVEQGWNCSGEPSVCSAPDLDVRITQAARSNENLDISYIVTNRGNAPSGPYRVDLWASRPLGFGTPPQPGDPADVSFVDRPSLDPGMSAMFTDTVPNAPNGDHVAFAAVDRGDDIVESDENNNLALGFNWSTAALAVSTSFPYLGEPVQIPDDGGAEGVEIMIDANINLFAPGIWISINATHPDVGQLSIEITAPDNSTRVLYAGSASGADFGGTTFTDAAPVAIDRAQAPFLGSFIPAEAWQPQAPASFGGAWRLRVVDTIEGGTGRVNAWSVSFYEIDP